MHIPVITPFFGIVIGWIYKYLCFENYMLTLVLFAIFIKVILFPFGIKQQKNSIKQAKLRPMEMAIRKKYAGRNDRATQQKLNEEVMALYQSENFNPASGCLPLLIQMPVLFGLYSVIVNPIKYISGLGADVVKVLTDFFKATNYDINIIKAINGMGEATRPAVLEQLNAQFASAGVDATAEGVTKTISELTENFTILGIDLTVNPTFALNPYIVIPILTFVFAFFSTKIIRKFTYQPQGAAEAQSSMAMMDWMMPLLSVWISFSVPAAIAIYWMLQNILSAVQQMILFKLYPIPVVTEEELKEAELRMKGKAAKQKAEKKEQSLPEPDPDSPIYEEVPEYEEDEQTSAIELKTLPLGLTNKFKNTLKNNKKAPKARRKI